MASMNSNKDHKHFNERNNQEFTHDEDRRKLKSPGLHRNFRQNEQANWNKPIASTNISRNRPHPDFDSTRTREATSSLLNVQKGFNNIDSIGLRSSVDKQLTGKDLDSTLISNRPKLIINARTLPAESTSHSIDSRNSNIFGDGKPRVEEPPEVI